MPPKNPRGSGSGGNTTAFTTTNTTNPASTTHPSHVNGNPHPHPYRFARNQYRRSRSMARYFSRFATRAAHPSPNDQSHFRRERDIEQLRRVALAQQIQIEQLLRVLKLKTKELEALKGDPAELQQTLALVETLTKQQQEAERVASSGAALALIGELYAIDERAGTDIERRAELRRTESAAVVEKLKTWTWNQAVLKTLSIGKAAAYVISNWERLIRFIDNPLVPLDNNATERAIRGPVVGRKNHYGSKSRRGTEVATIFYSLVETAKLHDIDPAAYLLEAVRAVDRGEILLPWQMPAAQIQPAVKTG